MNRPNNSQCAREALDDVSLIEDGDVDTGPHTAHDEAVMAQ